MRVSYYFKPKTKYPERIYVLYGDWRPRNMRQMGISKRRPFHTRKATTEEEEAMESATRMIYFQYEDIGTFLKDEAKFITDIQALKQKLCYELHSISTQLVDQIDKKELKAFADMERKRLIEKYSE